MSLITVHYRDVNHPQRDVKTVPVHQSVGSMFNIQKYITHLPMHPRPYYFNSITKIASSFTNHPQDVVITVKPYLKARLLFEDSTRNNQIVANHDLFSRHNGHVLNYMRLAGNYMPHGYQFLKPASASLRPSNDRTFRNGATEIIYVCPKVQPRPQANQQPRSNVQPQNNAQPSQQTAPQVTGTMQYVDKKSGRVLKTVQIRGHRDHKIDYSRYERAGYLPRGYQFVRTGTNTGNFLEPHAHYDIVVKPVVHRPVNITADVLYQDAQSHQIKKTATIHGHAGQSTEAYTGRNSRYLPHGYHFVKLLSNHGSQLQKGAIYIVLIKADPKRPAVVYAQLLYRDQQSGRIVKTVQLNGRPGSAINYSAYMNGSRLPAGYQFVAVSPQSKQTLISNGHYEILVRKPVHHERIHSTVNHQQRRSANNGIGNNTASALHNVRHFTQLPQINGNSKHDIGSILVALGASLNALGHALSRKNN